MLQTDRKQIFSVRVNPHFHRKSEADPKNQQSKLDFEMQCSVKASAPWVSVPKHFMLMNNGRTFKATVDPSNLPSGLHTAKICGFDSLHPERGVIWSLPITVTKPIEEQQRIELGVLKVRAPMNNFGG